MRHASVRSLLITAALALVAVAHSTASLASAACLGPVRTCGAGFGPCHCGDTVVVDTRLDGSDPVLRTPCPMNGLFVASGVTLTINGAIRAESGNTCSGIALLEGATDVVVTTGKIVGFQTGIGGEVTKSRFSRLQIAGGSVCLFLAGDDNTIESNAVTGCADSGIDIFGDRNRVSLNRAEDNGRHGITIGGLGNAVARNVALRNRANGFDIFGEEATVDRNQSRYNAHDGFLIAGKGHTVNLNVAEGNSNGIRTPKPPRPETTRNTFTRNRSNYNNFGIVDPELPFDENVYIANRCTGNVVAGSLPPQLCQ